MELLILFITLSLMVYGANLLVNGSVSIANRFNIPEFIIGALIVGVGTSLPELAVSLTATLSDLNDVSVGNVVGSNIFNVLCILGITGLMHPISINKESIKFDIPFCCIVSLLILLLSFNFFVGNVFSIGRIDGIILLSLFVFYVIKSMSSDNNQVTNEPNIKNDKLYKTILKIVVGLFLLVVNCDLFIDSAVNIARELNVSEAFISLTIVSCGTSLPELVSSVTAAFKKKSDIAIGNIVGSNIFNILFILGTCSLIKPLTNSSISFFDYLMMLISILLIYIFGHYGGKINRFTGCLMCLLFSVYTWYLLSIQ